MQKFENIQQILDFAISGEDKAYSFYMDLASKAHNLQMKEAFESFAAEELSHKAKLQQVKKHPDIVHLTDSRTGQVQTLGIADYTVEAQPSADMTYQESLLLAMKMEKAAYRMYLDLAAVAESRELTDMFLMLANEEARHKLRFEIEYDDIVFQED